MYYENYMWKFLQPFYLKELNLHFLHATGMVKKSIKTLVLIV